MKWIGVILLAAGFLWTLWAINDFVAYQYAHWMWQSQNLPAGETVKRTEAINAMRDLSLSLNDRHKKIILPAFLMLVGGLITAFGKRSKSPTIGKL